MRVLEVSGGFFYTFFFLEREGEVDVFIHCLLAFCDECQTVFLLLLGDQQRGKTIEETIKGELSGETNYFSLTGLTSSLFVHSKKKHTI